ncbi:biotin transporter BioY [Thermobrachium celere]|uniref:Biotin transporter n=1 Tax=Thermobrachium celere DSM 8682 TaxID=941824 RepID=R7RS73_9CLOT|nr:biotin transporter BioY [Thermobrachium celere]CDF58095.1 Substrate-specific component BioY of biotin ECF transporter [Thermobrachium celere DSM 8682]
MKTRDLVKIGLFAILTAIGAYISIPFFYVPFTLQIVFTILSGILLGAKNALYSQIVYLLLGLIGLPVFSGGTGGIQTVLKPSFGYIIGFIFGAFIIGKIIEQYKNLNIINVFLATIVGLMVIYLFGVTYLYIILNLYMQKQTTLFWVLKNGFLIFLPVDMLKCFIATVIGIKLKKHI